ncbi:uncharacterized protein K460DRAFT_363674 [Cucurbitaria berberidis CBS 394.84]|uniref:Uncharacterized protein n=1 Tax=Cucurbitaria berberidis CBS 394.84 TaxID=1168544 RepID=A0A9P4LAK4_9PLEO|nr:uncharacterized protein K460DRAFT_363674 [Cucurbitaria berberidis CBS 394.84]KAF1847613.1 hypothetical protein K460DRAFT_363674 [Cucurbitaria berberidis CBS 394.84]
MVYDFAIPEALTQLRAKIDQPHSMGMIIGVMLYYIAPLLSTHLDNAAAFQNKVPDALKCMTGFVTAIDQHIAYLRFTYGCSERFPDDTMVDRKGRRPRKKYMERYTYLVEATYKHCIREGLRDIFQAWRKEQTRDFNKGVDIVLSGIQWVVYPEKNVVVEVGEGDWAVWLRAQCEELGMEEARAGRKLLEDM